MKRRKRCKVCHELYLPYSRSFQRQKTCKKESCRNAWQRRLWKAWVERNPLNVGTSREKQAAWRKAHPSYWSQWRARHPGYVRRNREKQRRRNQEKRGLIAKPKGLEWIHREKLRRIEALQMIAKTKGIGEVFPVVIEGIRRYLAWSWMIAK